MSHISNAPLFHLLGIVSVQAGLLAVVVWAVCILLKKAPSKLRYALWLVVLIKFLLPPFACFPFHLVGGHAAPKAPALVSTGPNNAARSTAIDDAVPAAYPPTQETDVFDLVQSYSRVWLPYVWIAGVMVSISVLLRRQSRQKRLIRSCVAADETLFDMLLKAADDMGMKKPPRLMVSEQAYSPMVVGLLRPTIILPLGVISGAPASLSAILSHELAHIKRWDIAALWLQHFVHGMFLFHPCVWFAVRQAKRERELACDELVLSASHILPKDYAAGYVAALKVVAMAAPLPITLGMAEPFEAEKSRVLGMLHYRLTSITAAQALVALAVVVMGLPSFAEREGNVPLEVVRSLQRQAAPAVSVRYTSRWEQLRCDGSGRWTVIEATKTVSLHQYSRGTTRSIVSDLSSHVADASGDTAAGDPDRISGGESAAGPDFSVAAAELPLYEGPLYERIRLGVMSERVEIVDGHDCLRVTIPSVCSTVKNYVVWLDPMIGYNPRRIEFVWRAMQPCVIRYDDYRTLAEGVWFPRKQVLEYGSRFDGNVAFRVVNTVTKMNPEFNERAEKLHRLSAPARPY